MADFPALPLWTDALAADTDHLSHEEYGLYQRMLNVAWRISSCDLPNDAKWLMRRFRLSAVQYDDLCQPIIDEFWTLNGKNRLEQKRLKKERAWVSEKSTKSRRSATKRWNKTKEQDANAMLGQQCERNAPTPIPTPIDSEANASSAIAPSGVDLKSRIFGPALEWLAKQSAKPMSKLRSLVGRWCRDHGDGATLEAMQAAARAGPVEPIAWIEAKLNGTTRQVYGQPFKTSELLERMAENEAGGFGEEGDPGGDGDAVPLAIPGPERGSGGSVSNGHHRDAGAVQPDGAGASDDVGEVQANVDQDDMADTGGSMPSAFRRAATDAEAEEY